MKPRHPRSSFFLNSGLFDNIKNHADLESRISNLETNKERGDAFEVFAEAYIATQGIMQASAIWPYDSIPEQIKNTISVNTNRDMGIDGVYKSNSQDIVASQVKFRSRRPSLTWDDLSTFMGLTEQADQRLLFTNCDVLPDLMNARIKFFCVGGNDLDRLDSSDFEGIRAWLAKGIIKEKRSKPLPHQLKALQKIQDYYVNADRGTLIMACGTGKTLVGLWSAEGLLAKNIIILVPSLLLVRQTLHEWLHETEWENPSFICICSDQTVTKGTDNIVVKQTELDFSVTTDCNILKRYLSMPL